MAKNDVIFTLLPRAVGQAGSYDPDECLFSIEESLTSEEYFACETFLRWCMKNKLTFGHNIDSVWAKWVESCIMGTEGVYR